MCEISTPPAGHLSGWRFSLRSLMAGMAALAFVAFTVRLLVRFGYTPFDTMFLTLPWSLASFAGMLLASRLQRSNLLGGCFGGGAGASFSYFYDAAVARNLSPWPPVEVLFILAWSMSCGMTLAGMVALVEDAFPPKHTDDAWNDPPMVVKRYGQL